MFGVVVVLVVLCVILTVALVAALDKLAHPNYVHPDLSRVQWPIARPANSADIERRNV